MKKKRNISDLNVKANNPNNASEVIIDLNVKYFVKKYFLQIGNTT